MAVVLKKKKKKKVYRGSEWNQDRRVAIAIIQVRDSGGLDLGGGDSKR